MSERRGAIGVIVEGDRLLMVRRAEHLTSGGAWCFPGGHLEPGETSGQAVVRELREELGLCVETLALLGTIHVERPLPYRLDTWQVRIVAGDLRPDPREVSDVRLMTAHEILRLPDGMPSNARVLDLLAGRGANP